MVSKLSEVVFKRNKKRSKNPWTGEGGIAVKPNFVRKLYITEQWNT